MTKVLQLLKAQYKKSEKISEEFTFLNCEDNLEYDFKEEVESFLILNSACLSSVINSLEKTYDNKSFELTEKDLKILEIEINHIIESGANSIRLINVFENFLKSRG